MNEHNIFFIEVMVSRGTYNCIYKYLINLDSVAMVEENHMGDGIGAIIHLKSGERVVCERLDINKLRNKIVRD